MKNKTPEQVGAISRGIKLGRTLQRDHPEIADLYRAGLTATEISEELGIELKYSVSVNVARTGICMAYAGHNGGFNLDAYEGLIPDVEEREKLAREHLQEGGRKLHVEGKGIHGRSDEERSEAGHKGGRKTYEEGMGIHGMSDEERREIGLKSYEEGLGIHGRSAEQIRLDGRKGGRKSGLKNYEKGLGVHGRSAEQMSEDGRKAGLKGGRKAHEEGKGVHGMSDEERKEASLKAVIARGQTPWKEAEQVSGLTDIVERASERERAYDLSQQAEYQIGVRVNNRLIALELNIEYHDCEEVRTSSAVKIALSKHKKSLEGKIE